MKNNNKKWLARLLIPIAMSGFGLRPALADTYAAVGPNVPYSVAANLPFTPASNKLQYGEHALQFIELWLPDTAAPEGGFPLVIFIHGGCWLNQFDLTHAYPMASGLQQNGIAVASIEYRRTGDPGGGWPGTYQDIVDALKFLRDQSPTNLDLSKAILSGHSAGGHLALLAGGNPVFDWLKGVVGLAAIADIEAYGQGGNSCQRATAAFMEGTLADKPEAYRQANPQYQPRHKNSFLLQGGSDSIVPPSQAEGAKLPVMALPEAGHFDFLHPGSEAFRRFVERIQEMLKS